jgi:hypothetical protein
MLLDVICFSFLVALLRGGRIKEFPKFYKIWLLVISIGDIFIMLGAFLLVQRLMNKPISLLQLREGKSYATKN